MSRPTLEHSPVGTVDEDSWDQLAGGQFYSTSTWLRHCASYPGAVSSAVHVAAGDGAAAVPVAQFTAPPAANYDWSAILGRRNLPTPGADSLLVGPRLGYQTTVLRTGDDPHLARALVDAVRDSADDGCVALYLSTADVDFLRSGGVRAEPVLLEPDAWFAVPEGGWQAWVAAMPSRRRIRVQREARRFEESGSVITHVNLSSCYQRLAPLAEAMALKYGSPRRAPDFLAEFERYVRWTGSVARVALCEHGEDLTGFCIYYVCGDTIFLRWASFDYAKLTDSLEYFSVSYYSQVRLAGEVGARWLHAGKSALKAKVLRSARLRPLWLLDLTPDSHLIDHAEQIRRHNAARLSELQADPITRPALIELDQWEPYCAPLTARSQP